MFLRKLDESDIPADKIRHRRSEKIGLDNVIGIHDSDVLCSRINTCESVINSSRFVSFKIFNVDETDLLSESCRISLNGGPHRRVGRVVINDKHLIILVPLSRERFKRLHED